MLREPLLYLSLYLKRHRNEYYRLLDDVRSTGEWEKWIAFFADGIRESSAGAVATARRLVKLAATDRDRIGTLGRASSSALRIHHALQQRPVANAAQIAKRTKLSMPAIGRVLAALEEIGLVREITGRQRNRVFSYEGYVRILSEGTEPMGG